MSDQYAEEKRWVFSFYLKEESEGECLIERGKEFQSTGPMDVLKCRQAGTDSMATDLHHKELIQKSLFYHETNTYSCH